MIDTNPYRAPSAMLLVDAPQEGYALALNGFTRTTAMVRGYAIGTFIIAFCLLAAVAFFGIDSSDGRSFTFFAAIAVPLGTTYIVQGVMHWRLAGRIVITSRRADPLSIGMLFKHLRWTWRTSLVLLFVQFVYPFASNAVVEVMLVGAGVAAVVAEPLENDMVIEAQRLRTLVRVMFASAVCVVIFLIARQAYMEMDFGVAAVAIFAVPLGFGYALLVWRQLRPLNAFIAAPSPDTLMPVARAHRFFWTGLAVFGLVMIVLIAGYMVLAVAIF